MKKILAVFAISATTLLALAGCAPTASPAVTAPVVTSAPQTSPPQPLILPSAEPSATASSSSTPSPSATRTSSPTSAPSASSTLKAGVFGTFTYKQGDPTPKPFTFIVPSGGYQLLYSCTSATGAPDVSYATSGGGVAVSSGLSCNVGQTGVKLSAADVANSIGNKTTVSITGKLTQLKSLTFEARAL